MPRVTSRMELCLERKRALICVDSPTKWKNSVINITTHHSNKIFNLKYFQNYEDKTSICLKGELSVIL
jgi:hypothetical protein